MLKNVLSWSLLLLLICGSACAHAPQKVETWFDPDEHILKVTISHGVKDGGKHFVDEVTVSLNGKEVVRQILLAQENLESLTVLYRITDAGPGDEIGVSAACNLSGKKTAKIKVEPPPEKDSDKTSEKEAGKAAGE